MLKKELINRCKNILKSYKPFTDIIIDKSKSCENEEYFILTGRTEKKDYTFGVKIKGILKRPLPLDIFFKDLSPNVFPLIMAEYINSSISKDLIKENINFVDCQGNIYVDIQDQIYIEVIGKIKKILNEKKSSILFNQKGMQLLSILLNNVNLVNNSLRSLKEISGISLERASKIISELKENNYLISEKKDVLKLVNKKELFEKWISNYNIKFRPNLLIGNYKINSEIGFDKIYTLLKEKKQIFAFGGEVGAEILTNYYPTKTIDVFINLEQKDSIQKTLNLIPAQDYNLRLFILYSNDVLFMNESMEMPVVLPLLIYAELLYQGNDRAKETANMIFDTYIKDKLS